MKRLGLALLVVVALAPLAIALKLTNHEVVGMPQLYEARTSVVSTHVVTGLLSSWSVYAVGGTADFEFKYSTSVAVPYAAKNVYANSSVIVSSTIYLTDGMQVGDLEDGMVINPLIFIKRIDSPGTTVYVDISYITPRPGEF